MATGRLVSRGGRFSVIVDPDPKQVAKDIGRHINKPMKRTVGQLHKKYADLPIKEIQKRSARAPRGQVRIGRFVKASAAVSAITVLGGRGAADFAGQVWGSKRYRRFAPYTGGPYENTYVIGPVLRDEAFMQDFGEKFADGLSELIEKVWNGRG